MKSKLLVFFILSGLVWAQSITKYGGICVRIDDDQPETEWFKFDSVFKKYNFNFSLAINPTFILGNVPYQNSIRKLLARGNDLLDHTPDHRTNFFTNVNAQYPLFDTAGIHHINGDKVCFRYDNIALNSYVNEGKVDIASDYMISKNNGEFKELNLNINPYVYIPSLNKLYRIYKYKNAVQSDPDTVYLYSFWDEIITLPTLNNIDYHKINIYDVKMSNACISQIGKRSLYLFDRMGIPRPVFWAQPGGSNNMMNKYDLKSLYGDNLGFIGAAVYPNPSLMTYNEYNPDKTNQFAVQWGQLEPESQYFSSIKSVIADGYARHFLQIAGGHFDGTLLNGLTAYYTRMDSLLGWCSQNHIPVLTNTQWVKQLYMTETNPYENIFPMPNVDLDGNKRPDGYSAGTDYPRVDSTDGYPNASARSLIRTSKGVIFQIQQLGAIEKGENTFSFFIKGHANDTLRVVFSPNDKTDQTKVFHFRIPSSNWTKLTLNNSFTTNKKLVINDTVTTLGVYFEMPFRVNDTVKVSGFSLMKKSNNQMLPPWNLTCGLTVKNNVMLKWVDNSNNETGFNLERSMDDTLSFSLLSSIPPNLESFNDTTVQCNTQYYYRIRSVGQSGQSEYLNIAYIKTRPDSVTVSLVSDWNLFSVPYNPTNHSAHALLAAQGISIQSLFQYSNNSGYIRPDSLLPGIGYWVMLPAPISARFGGDLILDPLKLKVKSGFNLLGNPYSIGLAKSDIFIQYGDLLVPFQQAAEMGWVSSGLFKWTPQGYELSDSLPVGAAFWSMMLRDSLSFIFNKPNSTFERLPDSPIKLGIPESKINLKVSFNNHFDSLLSIGFAPDATNGFDPLYDIPEAPSLPNQHFPVCVIKHHDWLPEMTQRFISDIRSSEDPSQEWNINLDSLKRGNIYFSWDIYGMPDTASIFLYDSVTGAEINMKQQSGYAFNFDGNDPFRIKVAASRLSSITKDVLPKDFSMSQNYPNPFNPVTRVAYELPAASEVSIKVYDLLGREIAKLYNGYKLPGKYSVTWDAGNYGSGVYFCVLRTRNVVISKKMVLIK